MKRSTDRILTTHAGSMIRPPEVLALGPDMDEPTTTATLRKAVADVVRQQVELGVDVISDGEFGKSSWFTYVMERLDGYEVRPVPKPEIGFLGRDESRYPDFFQTSGMGRARRRIGEIDTAVRLHHHVIGSIQLQSAIAVGDDGDAPVNFLTIDAATEVVAHHEPTELVARLAIAIEGLIFVDCDGDSAVGC